MSEAVLEIKNLTKHFPVKKGLFRRTVGYVKAVDGVTFTINKGETLGLIGESGCGKTTVGKLIQGSAWYFAANVNEEDAASLKENSRLTLRMASGVDFDLPVTLTRISAAENGKCLIVLRSTRYLSYMTLLREQNAELIISAYDGLRVPKNALRVDENGVSGVYCLVGRVAYFKPVSIVYQLSLIHI